MNHRDSYLTTIIDAVPDVLLVQDRAGRIRMANRATTEVLGKPLETILGRRHRQVSDRPDDVARLGEQIREVLKTGVASAVERSIAHPVTGETRWFQTRVLPLVPPEGGPTQRRWWSEPTSRLGAMPKARYGPRSRR